MTTPLTTEQIQAIFRDQWPPTEPWCNTHWRPIKICRLLKKDQGCSE